MHSRRLHILPYNNYATLTWYIWCSKNILHTNGYIQNIVCSHYVYIYMYMKTHQTTNTPTVYFIRLSYARVELCAILLRC